MGRSVIDVLGRVDGGETATGYRSTSRKRAERETPVTDDAEWRQRLNFSSDEDGTGVRRYSVNTSLTAERIAGVAPSIPNSPEEITVRFRKRWIKAMPKAKDFLIDEHKFLDKQELAERRDNALDELPLQYVYFCDDVLTGTRPPDAYLIHIKKLKAEQITTQMRSHVRADAHRLLKKEPVKEYISASIKLSNLETMDKLQFNEAEWLSLQRDLIHMAMGRKPTPKTFVVNGEVVEHEVKDVALAVSARALETVAKMNGWLSEKMELTGDIPTIFLKDFAGSSANEKEPIDGTAEKNDGIEDAEFTEDGDELKTIGFADTDNEADYNVPEPQARELDYDWES